MKDWIDDLCGCDFFENIPYGSEDLHIGQFFEGHIKYPFFTSPKVLELDRYDQENELNSIFKIVDYNPSSIGQRMRPIRQLNLRSTDRLYIIPGKIRTVILLKIIENIWIEDEIINMALCLPTSSFKDYHSRDFVIKTQLFDFPQFFYIKPSENGAKAESAARFDLLQFIPLANLKPVKNETSDSCFMLSTFIMKLMFNHMSKFIFGEPYDVALDEEIIAFRDIILSDENLQV